MLLSPLLLYNALRSAVQREKPWRTRRKRSKQGDLVAARAAAENQMTKNPEADAKAAVRKAAAEEVRKVKAAAAQVVAIAKAAKNNKGEFGIADCGFRNCEFFSRA